MPEIKLEHVTKRWGKFYAVDDLDLVIQDNAFVTLLGPSGCGKTTTLRMIAGLETPTSGRITIGDQVVFDSALGINIPANKRKVGFLFQNYALWPNMTVYENISFGLKNIKEPLPKVDFEAKNAARLAEILEQPAEVVRVLEECRDKDGRLDQKKAQLKLVDTFTISIYTAKQLLSYRLEQSPDLSGEIASLRGRVEAARQSAAAAGGELDGEFRLVKGGQVITETRKLTREEIDLTVRRVARIVKIGMFMDRYPAELSGGQQQRVAIARTLAPEPSVLFMDEPLSNLDAKLRLEMRYELQRLHVETGSTFVYVTHDQMEAMTLATQICLIENGVLQQYDAPLTVYHQPNNLFVADFVGNPSINFVEAKGAQRADGAVELTVFQGRKALFRPAPHWTCPSGSGTGPPRRRPGRRPIGSARQRSPMWRRAIRTRLSATTSPRWWRTTTPSRTIQCSPTRTWCWASARSFWILRTRVPWRGRSMVPCPPAWSPPSRCGWTTSCSPASFSAAPCSPSERRCL